jgi:hypothetical protein
MCLNACVFNTTGDEYWLEARKFQEAGLAVFDKLDRKTHITAFGVEMFELVQEYDVKKELYQLNNRKIKKSINRVNNSLKRDVSDTILSNDINYDIKNNNGKKSKKILNSDNNGNNGNNIDNIDITMSNDIHKNNQIKADSNELALQEEMKGKGTDLDPIQIILPNNLTAPPQPPSYYSCSILLQSSEEAYYSSCQDSCLLCGSSGSCESFIYCIDCGESFHSFCVEIPLYTMKYENRINWRCSGCKICEICNSARKEDCGENYCYFKSLSLKSMSRYIIVIFFYFLSIYISIGDNLLLFCEICDQGTISSLSISLSMYLTRYLSNYLSNSLSIYLAYHLSCLSPVLSKVPQCSWVCLNCTDCQISTCKSKLLIKNGDNINNNYLLQLKNEVFSDSNIGDIDNDAGSEKGLITKSWGLSVIECYNCKVESMARYVSICLSIYLSPISNCYIFNYYLINYYIFN